MEYASRAVGNAGLTTGVIGTTLGVLNGAGGIGELIGAGTRPRGPQNEGDIPVTRHDMGLYRELSEKDFKIASLEANKYTDQQIRELSEKMNAKIDAFAAQTGMRLDGIQQQIGAQSVWNATQQGNLACLQRYGSRGNDTRKASRMVFEKARTAYRSFQREERGREGFE